MNAEEIEAEKSDEVLEKPEAAAGQIIIICLMLACSLGAIGLIIFTSRTGSLILQACLFGLSFLLSRGLIQQSDEQKTVKSNSKTNIFSIQLEKFFEQKMAESKQINPQ